MEELEGTNILTSRSQVRFQPSSILSHSSTCRVNIINNPKTRTIELKRTYNVNRGQLSPRQLGVKSERGQSGIHLGDKSERKTQMQRGDQTMSRFHCEKTQKSSRSGRQEQYDENGLMLPQESRLQKTQSHKGKMQKHLTQLKENQPKFTEGIDPSKPQTSIETPSKLSLMKQSASFLISDFQKMPSAGEREQKQFESRTVNLDSRCQSNRMRLVMLTLPRQRV